MSEKEYIFLKYRTGHEKAFQVVSSYKVHNGECAVLKEVDKAEVMPYLPKEMKGHRPRDKGDML